MLFITLKFIYVGKQASTDTADNLEIIFFVIPERYILLGSIFVNPDVGHCICRDNTQRHLRPTVLPVNFPAEDKGYSLIYSG